MAIHSSAFVHPTAELDPSVEVGPLCRIDEGCILGEGNVLMQGAILGPNTKAGRGNTFHFNSVVGHDPQFLGFDPRTKSGTIIGDGNHFREFSSIHRGLKEGLNTLIGDRNYFMATSHAGHDCVIGNDNVFANCCVLAGHVAIGDKCFLSGISGVQQYCRIGSFAMIGGRSSITSDAPPYMMYLGANEAVGINSVGLRRAGISSASRIALKNAYKTIFRRGLSMPKALATIREQWEGREMPQELQHLIDFCSSKSKRGFCHGPRVGIGGKAPAPSAEEND